MNARVGELLTLDNCDKEPIHIPGQIQSHGALFAFDAGGTLLHRSANAQDLLGTGIPALGEKLAAQHFAAYPGFHELMAQVQQTPGANAPGYAAEIDTASGAFSIIAHRHAGRLICEFEDNTNAVAQEPGFSFSVHRTMETLRRQTTVQGLLEVAVAEVRRLTGFDRVMAYRFRHDDSGDIVAESVEPALEPFLGRRYPPGDIPAQARRLYVLNTLRLIADVHARPVSVDALRGTGEPLDMSHGVLRSVSPVHLEYLNNMGVAASMSISVVIGGRLWGMLACHHMKTRRVNYAVRMACDVLAQLLASNVQATLVKQQAARVDKADVFRSRLMEKLLQANGLGDALSAEARVLCEGFGAHGAVLADGVKLEVHANLPSDAAAALVRWLNDQKPVAGRMVHVNTLGDAPSALREHMGAWCGVLAMPFGVESLCWLVLLRKEQVETVMWGGRPEKVYTAGPLGARLTPRGSFDLWREIVKGHAVPWDETDLQSAQKLLDKLMWADASQIAETNRSRLQLMAMLGHDLRDPLQAITNSAAILALRGSDKGIGKRIQSASARMQRLIGQVMDMSLLRSGGLRFQMKPLDLTALLHELIAESRGARPGVRIQPIAPPQLMVQADGDRIAQVLGNLLANASQHGTPGTPVLVHLSESKGWVALEVSNEGRPLPEAVVANLFQPFKRGEALAMTNRNGLGLGLYIAQQVMAGHGGELRFAYEEPYVIFTATFPASREAATA